jgi:hypothetical protein
VQKTRRLSGIEKRQGEGGFQKLELEVEYPLKSLILPYPQLTGKKEYFNKIIIQYFYSSKRLRVRDLTF